MTYENTGGYLALQSNDWTGASYGGIAFGDDLPAAVTFNTSALTLNSSAILDDVLSPINDFVPADSDSGAGFSTILTPDTNGEDLWNVNTDDELAPTDPDAVDLSDDDFFVDPIVLNLNGGAVVTTDQNTNEVTFDMRGQGTLEGTGWITSGEGFLVIDKEGTGTITSSHEMISDMNELASYDSNGDGEITAADQRFDTPRVWVPGANGGPGSLFTLPQLGITEIGLTANMVDQADNGNLIKNTFTFDYANGTTGQGADVYFSLAGDPPIIASPAEASALAAGPPSYRNLGSTSDIAFFNPAAQLADVNNIVSAATAGGTAAPSSAAGAPESAQNSTSTLADIPAQSGQITVADVTSAGAAAAMGQNTVPDQATPAGWASLELSQGLTFISAGTAVQPVGTSGAGIAAPVAPPRCRNLPYRPIRSPSPTLRHQGRCSPPFRHRHSTQRFSPVSALHFMSRQSRALGRSPDRVNRRLVDPAAARVRPDIEMYG